MAARSSSSDASAACEAGPEPQELGGRFQRVGLLGSGAYSSVFLAKDTRTDELVALKSVRLARYAAEGEGIPASTLREVALLRELSGCPQIVCLKEVIMGPQAITLVLEYMSHDLRSFLRLHRPSPTVSRCMVYQLLQAVAACHRKGFVHRDIKPENVLVHTQSKRCRCSEAFPPSFSSHARMSGSESDGDDIIEHRCSCLTPSDVAVKLADFGLGRASLPWEGLTTEVVTLWYRAPEVLLGGQYAAPVDIWSVGCIFAELLGRGRILFAGDSQIDQIFRIFSALGTPNEDVWPGVSKCSDYRPTFPQWSPQVRELRSLVSEACDEAFGLLLVGTFFQL